MKKLMMLIVTMVMALTMVGCGDRDAEGGAGTPAEGAVYAPIPDSNNPWTLCETAEETALAAGVETFQVPEEITIEGRSLQGPAFSQRDGTAQASYTDGATEVYIRKGKGTYGTPLTDLQPEQQYPESWQIDLDGTAVTCYGAKGNPVVMQWSRDDEAFAVTYIGLNGENVTMPADTAQEILLSIR